MDQLRADAASRPATYGYIGDPTTASILNYYGFLEYAGGIEGGFRVWVLPDSCSLKPTHSHSMVPGGLLVMSSATRFTPGTSLIMRLLIFSRRS